MLFMTVVETLKNSIFTELYWESRVKNYVDKSLGTDVVLIWFFSEFCRIYWALLGKT